MQALVIHKAQDLRIEEQPIAEPDAGQIKVKVARGGICGSDLHYYLHGGFGSIRLKEPMIPGHEFSGYVDTMGDGVTGFRPGELVAISPSRPCHDCEYCQKTLFNQCLNMRFYGSAMPFPHIQGGFCEELIVDASQCVSAQGLSPAAAAMAEPFSVGLHACHRAGDLSGKRVLITGSGPIGVLAAVAARVRGAAHIIMTDLRDNALRFAEMAGADTCINLATDADGLKPYTQGKGSLDILIECTGAPQALDGGIDALAPRGIVMQLGLGGDMPVPMLKVTAKELEIRGSFRFHEEFSQAIRLMQSGAVDLTPFISHSFPMQEAKRAFEVAADRDQAMKTQIIFHDAAA